MHCPNTLKVIEVPLVPLWLDFTAISVFTLKEQSVQGIQNLFDSWSNFIHVECCPDFGSQRKWKSVLPTGLK